MTNKKTAVENEEAQMLAQQEKNEGVVTLDSPIVRGNVTITEITVRKPQSGALRGTRLQALMEMDVDSIMTVLPRVTYPVLTKPELLVMDPADLINLGVEVVGFLLPKSAKSDSQIS